MAPKAPKRKNVRKGFQDVDSAWARFEKVLKDYRPSKDPTKHHIARRKANSSGKLSKAAEKYKRFLDKVRGANDRHLFTIAFSQAQIDSTKAVILEGLVSKFNGPRSHEAIAQASHQSFDTSLENNQVLWQPQAQSLKSMVEYADVPPEGIKEAFGHYLVNKIEAAEINETWRAVTMRLPEWADEESESEMSLEISRECVNELAMALFKVEVERIADTYHIVHADGMVQIIHPVVHELIGVVQFEHDLIGVLDEDIYAVFGSTVYEAINASPTRKKELAKGVGKTKCVKMTLSKEKSKINLSMSYFGGVSVVKKLWTTVPKP